MLCSVQQPFQPRRPTRFPSSVHQQCMLSGQFLMSPKSFLPRSLAPRCCNAIASAPKAEAEESAPRCAAQGLFGDRGQSAAGGQGWHFSVLVFCGFGFFFLAFMVICSCPCWIATSFPSVWVRSFLQWPCAVLSDRVFLLPLPDDTF